MQDAAASRGDNRAAEVVDDLKILPEVPAPVDAHLITQRRVDDPGRAGRQRLKTVFQCPDRVCAGNGETPQSA